MLSLILPPILSKILIGAGIVFLVWLIYIAGYSKAVRDNERIIKSGQK